MTAIAIVGSREYPSRQDVFDYVSCLPGHYTVISGGARGVDTWAEQAALEHGLNTVILKAQWKVKGHYDRDAGFKRNELVVKQADFVVAFWDGKSAGTGHTIDLAYKAGKLLFVLHPAKKLNPDATPTI